MNRGGKKNDIMVVILCSRSHNATRSIIIVNQITSNIKVSIQPLFIDKKNNLVTSPVVHDSLVVQYILYGCKGYQRKLLSAKARPHEGQQKTTI